MDRSGATRTLCAVWLFAVAWPAWGVAGRDLHLICPCSAEVSADGEVTATFGVRNYSQRDSGVVTVGLAYYYESDSGPRHWVQATLPLAWLPLETVGPSSALPVAPRAFPNNPAPLFSHVDSVWMIRLELHEGDQPRASVTLTNVDGAGPGRFIDYLHDADGDGVGDVNESLARTDSEDAESTPGEQEIDLLMIHFADLREAYDGDHHARIRHLTTVTNRIYRTADAGIRFRIVGVFEADASMVEEDWSLRLRLPYGADELVGFWPEIDSFCGRSPLKGGGYNGFLQQPNNYAFWVWPEVVTSCGDEIMGHELGHAFGLAHPFEQNTRGGTYLWSRGHYVGAPNLGAVGSNSPGTMMSYGHTFEHVIASPSVDCGGLPCGKARGSWDSADAVASLRVTRFQAARWGESKPDSDGDGFVDPVDAFPTDSAEWTDLDEDGVGDNADLDDDGDGVADAEDAFPREGGEWVDADADGVGDNQDAFPNDPAETSDRDGDGVGDNRDAFPDNGAEWVDSDNDGVGDNADAFPNNPREWADSDRDGVGDNRDAFPNDDREWADADRDNIGDNLDALVDTDNDGVANDLDPDDDGDGVPDATDMFPLDRAGLFYKLAGEPGRLTGRAVSSAGDVDGDGAADMIIVEPAPWWELRDSAGAYVVAAADLRAADLSDGSTDRVARLGSAAAQPHSRRIISDFPWGRDFSEWADSAGDIDGDGLDDVIVSGNNRFRFTSSDGSIFIVSGADIASSEGGALDIYRDSWWGFHVHDHPESERDALRGIHAVASAGDVDMDGVPDIIFGSLGDGQVNNGIPRGSASLLTGAELRRRVRAGQSTEEPMPPSGAWRFFGEESGPTRTGTDVGSTGDIDGDGRDDVFVIASEVAWEGNWHNPSPTGALYLVAAADLPALDAADETPDGKISLRAVADAPASWKLIGSRPRDLADTYAGLSIAINAASAGDMDGDGVPELLIGAPATAPAVLPASPDARWGAAYVVSPAGLAAADAADSVADGVATLGNAASWTLRWPAGPFGITCCEIEPAGDVDGDGLADILVGATNSSFSPHWAFLIASRDLPAADRADGEADRAVDLANVAALPNSWRFVTERQSGSYYGWLEAVSAGDVDGDGVPDLILGEANYYSDPPRGHAYLLSGAREDLALFDERDGTVDGTIDLENIKFHFEPPTSPRAPSVATPSPVVALQPDGDSAAVDLSRVFSPGRDGGALRFEARSDNSALATTAITDGKLTITSNANAAEGDLTITVTAVNDHGFRATHHIQVSVSFSHRPFAHGWRLTLEPEAPP